MKRVRLLLTCLVALTPGAGALGEERTLAPDPAHLRQLSETGACPGCLLQGADLRGAALAGADLSHANLAGADLTGADLRGADLTSADLTEAVLEGADLTGANMRATQLSGARMLTAIVVPRELWDAIICWTWLPDGQMYLLQQNCP